ncbi:MMPL family transporter [Oerskovia sp. KBS0722]|uniref:MMPL family transporter n=1 Tax=Oerskovia sp. KBS0722 TaxID=1179673 RepID=UPI00110F0272|nr:MMPL family transporter [Oerskovia sp. KBS0722]QDW63366.1 MMPL family transporter [Oerskovia sp. KBS0722]
MFGSIARTVIAHPWRVIGVWVLLATAVVVFSPNLDDYTTGNQQSFLPASFESVEAQDAGAENFPAQSGATGSLVVVRSDGAALTADDQTAVAGLATTLQGDAIPGVVSVQETPQSLSQDGQTAALSVAFDGQPGDEAVDDAVPALRTATDAALQGTDLTGALTGSAAIQVDTTTAYAAAERTITIATVLLIVVLLGLVFRSPAIAVIPIVVIGVVLSVVTGLTAWLADLLDFQVSDTLQPILVVVLFGIGTDYIVFVLFRYREHLRRGESHHEALEASVGVVGRVVASSALTVIGAFAALLFAQLESLSTLAPGLIVAVAVMLVTALTLVPALFALLGRALFWPLGPGHDARRSPFAALGSFTARRPAVPALAVGAVLVLLTLFASGYKATYDTLDELPADTASRQAYTTLDASFPAGALSPTQVYVVGTTPLDPAALSTLATNLAAVPGVTSVAPPTATTDGTAALVTVVLADDPYSDAAMATVEGPLRDAAHGSVPGAQVYVGGQTSAFVDVRDQLRADTGRVFPIAAVIIVVILGLLLTALLGAVNLLVCVALTFTATLGAVVLLYLHALGYAGIDFSIPIVLYLFVVAIGTDYNILVAARMHEEYRAGATAREAAHVAITQDAPTAAAAGIILACTFASLMLTGIANLAQLGFGVAVGIVAAAFLMAPLLVPALTALEGRAFWWPTRRAVVGLPRAEPEPGPADASADVAPSG